MDEKGMKRLMASHAYWAEQVKELRRRTSESLDNCTRVQPIQGSQGFPLCPMHDNCIENAYQEWKASDSPYDGGPSFEEVWGDMIEEGEVCIHCQRTRQLKKRRAEAGRRLGQVRSAITKAGRKFQEETTC